EVDEDDDLGIDEDKDYGKEESNLSEPKKFNFGNSITGLLFDDGSSCAYADDNNLSIINEEEEEAEGGDSINPVIMGVDSNNNVITSTVEIVVYLDRYRLFASLYDDGESLSPVPFKLFKLP
ncbi:MAG: hypothetical protein R3321_12505, partial [Nitrososphaeraceae archaeon]|nr:hypothetical protein [Nitrososphaeraceae archaeon]